MGHTIFYCFLRVLNLLSSFGTLEKTKAAQQNQFSLKLYYCQNLSSHYVWWYTPEILVPRRPQQDCGFIYFIISLFIAYACAIYTRICLCMCALALHWKSKDNFPNTTLVAGTELTLSTLAAKMTSEPSCWPQV